MRCKSHDLPLKCLWFTVPGIRWKIDLRGKKKESAHLRGYTPASMNRRKCVINTLECLWHSWIWCSHSTHYKAGSFMMGGRIIWKQRAFVWASVATIHHHPYKTPPGLQNMCDVKLGLYSQYFLSPLIWSSVYLHVSPQILKQPCSDLGGECFLKLEDLIIIIKKRPHVAWTSSMQI